MENEVAKIGVYSIRNTITNDLYVGATKDINRRIAEHKSRGRYEKHQQQLYKDFRKYNVDNFIFKTLEITEIESIHDREIFWIKELNPSYNNNSGGKGNPGHIVSEKTRNILSIRGKKQWHNLSEEDKQHRILNNLVGSGKGYKVSDKTKLRLRSYRLGSTASLETKHKISESQKISMIGNKNGNKKVSSYKDGVLVKNYDSIIDASTELKIHPSNITKVLKDVQNTAGGYKWKYQLI